MIEVSDLNLSSLDIGIEQALGADTATCRDEGVGESAGGVAVYKVKMTVLVKVGCHDRSAGTKRVSDIKSSCAAGTFENDPEA